MARSAAAQGRTSQLDLRRAPHRLCPFYDRKWELLNGYPPRNTADPDSPFTLTFYETRDGRWVMPLNLYPRLQDRRRCACSNCCRRPEGRGAGHPRLEGAPSWRRRAPQAGVVMPMMRSVEEFLQEPQYRDVLQALPLIEIEKIGDCRPDAVHARPAARRCRACARSAWRA